MEQVPQRQSFANERDTEIFVLTRVDEWFSKFKSPKDSLEARLKVIELVDQPEPTQRHETSAIRTIGARDENKQRWSSTKESNRPIHPATEKIDDSEDTVTDIDTSSQSGHSGDDVEETPITARSENSRSASRVPELWEEQLIKSIRLLLVRFGYSSTANTQEPGRIILSVQNLAELNQKLEVTLCIRGVATNSTKTSR